MRQGIYTITNLENGRLYVGSSIRIEKRWANHLYYLKLGKHHSRKLQNAWNKYGENAFRFEILEDVANVEKLIEREQAAIDLLRPYYNVKPSAVLGRLGLPHSQETRRKISELRKGFQFSDEAKQKMSESAQRRQQEGRGSLKKGEQSRTAKLNEVTVKEIRRLILSGTVTQKYITELYSVHRETVRLIGLRKIWAHVE